MRLSTNVIFDSGTARLGDLQSGLAKTQNQIATGRRILTPADDPVAANHALEVTQAQAINAQLGVNRKSAKESLSMEESVLQNVTGLLHELKTKVVEAGNAALSSSERNFIATELSGRMADLMGLANSRDGAGYYLFAGYQTTTQPFVKSSTTGADYVGDQGRRILQVGSARQLELGDPGNEVFERNRTGNGTFTTAANGTNTGSGIISSGSVVDKTLLTGVDYQLAFAIDPVTGATTYDVLDVTNGATISAGNTYVSGESIAFDGLQFEISGTPADGDTFDVTPSKNQSIFTTLNDLISALKSSTSGDAGQAALTNALNTANDNITNALDNVLTVRASLGARLSELIALDSEGESRDLQYAQTLTELQELDYTKAITDLSKRKIILEAAQQSFVKTSGLSLFNYIS